MAFNFSMIILTPSLAFNNSSSTRFFLDMYMYYYHRVTISIDVTTRIGTSFEIGGFMKWNF